jgi:hypothetical protein
MTRECWPLDNSPLIFHLTAASQAFAGCILPLGISKGGFVNSKTLAAQWRLDQYGDFRLTEAVRPAPGVSIVPRQGYRREVYREPKLDLRVPVLAASVSRESLFDVFLSLLEPLGPVADVVLETSHEKKGGGHHDLFRERIDLPVLVSHLYDFEDLLLNDGCTGLAVVGVTGPMEVQFDEHKLLIVYAHDLTPFEAIVKQAGLRRDDSMKLITEAEHLHATEPHYVSAFEQLAYRLGVGEPAEHANW